MPGELQAAGAIAKLADTIASWWMSEDGYGEWKKRKQLAAVKEKARRALIDHDWVALRTATDELQRLSSKP